MTNLDKYIRQTGAVDYFVRVVKNEDGKALVLSIHPYGVPADPLEFKVETEKKGS